MPLDTELFICEVLKKKLWIEIFEKFVEIWSELGTAEKEEKGQELQKKWKNLRTCFKREYDAQKNEPSGTGRNKRRKYIYFDQLLFLHDSVESRETINSLGDKDHVGDVEIEMEETDVLGNPVSVNNPPTNATVRPVTTPSVKRKKVPQKSYEESLLHILKQKRDEDREIDEDKYFLLSLLPSFKKMNEDQKFFVRTEFLNVMRRWFAISPLSAILR
ncbi:Alcohol dehydrogenase transcription factor Myb/SANT-like [Popillia japonica]|uniref:Alcohol dehydrogenase transcription factor Myb/SANT-like n=1 Tax=Popillia japonica TaxID=7064 RepID=A0AAW1JUK7_POPJA